MEEALRKACEGKTKSRGGMNVGEMKEALIDLFPDKEEEIRRKNRKQLETFCRRNLSRGGSTERAHGKTNGKAKKARYFLPGSPLNTSQQAYCRCLAHVAAKNDPVCYRTGEWKTARKGSRCVNPYAVCTKSTGRKGRFHCAKYYDLDDMPDHEVEAVAALHDKTVLS